MPRKAAEASSVPDSDLEVSDAELVRRTLAGRTEAFGLLVRRHQDRVFALLKRKLPASEVEEAAQTAFIVAYEKLADLREPKAFRAWVSVLALNRAARYWRDNAGGRTTSLDQAAESDEGLDRLLRADSMLRRDDEEAAVEARFVVGKLLALVSEEDQSALALYYGEGMDVAEVGRTLGWSAEKVKIRLFRARKRMARFLEEDDLGRMRS